MAHQIIRQPDGKLAVFSSVVDDWIFFDASPEELAEQYAAEAAAKAREHTLKTARAVLDGNARSVYYQFTMTYEEACAAAGHTPAETDDEDA
jgi:hypothetical protein